MESYYEKYGSLLDSDFHAFIAQALPFGLCGTLPDTLNLVPKLSLIQRNLIGEGSHRHLSSSIRFNIDPKSITDLPTHSCEVIIIERLPSGVFADPFELQHLLQRGGKILYSFLLLKKNLSKFLNQAYCIIISQVN